MNALLAPYLRHRATCFLQAVRDNAPDDPTCTCGLREAHAAATKQVAELQAYMKIVRDAFARRGHPAVVADIDAVLAAAKVPSA